MKQKLLKLCTLAAFLILEQMNVSAQTLGDYRSKDSGVWGSGSIAASNLVLGSWEVYDGAAWVDAVDYPSATSNVTIRKGHTITIEGTKSVNTLLIENGGTLKSTGGLRNLRVVTSITNNGAFGSTGTNERVSIEGYRENGTMTITGTGTYLVGLIRTNGVVKVVDLVIDADIDMSSYLTGPYTFTSTGSNSALQYDDRVNIIINAGKTVTFGSAAYLHSNLTSLGTANIPYGEYTYTINGTLDMSKSGTSAIIEKQDTASVTTVNVNGLLKLGTGFRTASNAATAPAGIVKLNVGPNGVVDASLVASNMVMTNTPTGLYSFFNITGNGVVKQNPAKHASQNLFRVGTGGVYSPVTIDAAAKPNAVFTVNISASADGGKKAVNRVWNISSATAVADLILKFGSVAAIEKNGFNITDPVLAYPWNGSAWDAGVAATVAGDGTLANPHTAQIASVNTLGKFTVANETPAILPLKFISVNAKINATGKQTVITWQTADEKNTLDFVIEKSTDGVNFNPIGIVGAINILGLNNYSHTDNDVDAGTSYYRINQRDIDGKSAISKMVSVNQKSQIAISIYPNPVINVLNISYPLSLTDGKVTVYNTNGNTVITQKTSSNSTSSTVNVAQLVPAVYVVELSTGSETVVKRFVKQ